MPYTNNNFQNGIGLGYQNPIKKAFLNKNENSIIEAFNKQYQNYKRSVHSQPQVSPPKATTFMDGVKANLQRFGNDLEYLSAEIQKKSAGEEFFTDVISKLQNFYNGNLAKQPIHELRQRMRKIEDDNYEVPFPSMNPTHAISLRQPRSMESSVEYDMLKKIVTMKEKGYSNDYIKNWLDDLYHVGGEGTKRQKEVLRKAEKIPETEGWGKVGDVATGLLDILIPIAGGLVNPALGTGLMSLSLGKGLSQNIASANKEIDLYEKNTNQKVSDADRRTYVLGVAATDMLLGSIMQTRYLKNIDLPLVGALRKSLFNKLLNNKQAITEFNHLFRNSLKQSVPKILNKSGQMAVEQAGASGTSALARNMLGMVYKDSEHYPSLNEIVKDVTNEALYGAATGAVTGGISKGLGILTKPNISKSRITPYKLNLPDNPLFDLEGLTPQGYLDRENKIKQIIKDNFKSKSSYANDLPAENRLPLTEQYKLNLPDNPLFDIGEMSLKEYNELVPQLRSALREYYLPKDIQPDNLPAENRLPLSEQYKLKLPDNPLFDMEGLSLNEWLEREAKIKDILKENYIPTPPKRDISLPYKLNLPDNPLFDLEGLTPQGYLDRENKIKQIIKDNFKSKSSYANDLPAENRLPLSEQYKLNLPDNPLFDIGEMSLKEYNELVPQLRSALREYYLPKDIQPDNLPAKNRLPLSEQYKLKLPDNPLFDMEGLSLNEWLEREAKIKDILKDNYIPTPPKRDISLPYKLNLPDNPLFDLEGLTPQGYLDRENKIKQIIKDNFKSKSSYADDLPAENRLPLSEQYKLNLPDNPLFDIGEMSLKEYNELVPQLRSALREYYLPKDIQPDNLPAENRLPLSEQYKLKLPDNPLFDMEGLSLNEWLEREAKIKDILKENYIPTPPKRDISGYNTSLHDDLSQKDIWQEGELGNEYSNTLKRSLVKEEGDKLNIRTRMFNNLGELPEGYKKYLDDHSYSKGFYNPETEEVVIIGNNIASHSDLQNILIQKAYESKGLENVLGNELDNLLEEVYNNMSNRDSKVYSQNGDTSQKVALSYISDLAKNPRINPEEWNRLSSYVRELFKTKYNIQNLTDETIKNLLWRTANQITGDDSIEEMIRKSR